MALALPNILECVVVFLREISAVERHTLRVFRHFDDLREMRFSALDLCRRYVIFSTAPVSRVAFARVALARLFVINLDAMHFLTRAFLERADLPVLDIACDVDPLDLGEQRSAIAPRFLP